MLELEDVQHYLLTRPHATIAQYNFITFHSAEGGRKWVNTLSDIVGTAKTVMAASETDMRWVSLGFTFNGLRKLGLDENSLASFPEPFRQDTYWYLSAVPELMALAAGRFEAFMSQAEAGDE